MRSSHSSGRRRIEGAAERGGVTRRFDGMLQGEGTQRRCGRRGGSRRCSTAAGRRQEGRIQTIQRQRIVLALKRERYEL